MKLTSAEFRLRAMGMATTLLLVVAFSACSSSGARSDPSGSSSTDVATSTSTVTSTTQPPSSAKAIVPVMDTLLHQWDTSLTAILQAPSAVLKDPDDPRRVTLKSAFTSDSPYVADIDKLVKGYADRGQANRLGPSKKGQQSLYMRPTAAHDPNSLTFLWCSFDDSITYDVKTGKGVDANIGITQGEGLAVRKAGVWRLYRLRQITFASKPPGTTNPCPGWARGARGPA